VVPPLGCVTSSPALHRPASPMAHGSRHQPRHGAGFPAENPAPTHGARQGPGSPCRQLRAQRYGSIDPRKVPVSARTELAVGPGDLWAPLQEQPLGTASSSPSQESRSGRAPGLIPAEPPAFPPPQPCFPPDVGAGGRNGSFPPQSLPCLSPAPVPEAGSDQAG